MDIGQKIKGIQDIFVIFKGLGILGSILGILGYNAFSILGIFAIFI